MKKVLSYLLLLLVLSTGNVFLAHSQVAGVIASSATTGGGGSTLDNGRQAHWLLDEVSGDAIDAMGNYNGTCTAITYAGTYYTFNGSSSNVSFGNVIKPTNAITISAKIRTSYTGSDQSVIDCHKYGTNWEGYNVMIYTDGAVGFFLGSNTAVMLDKAENPIYPTLVNDGQWHHIVAMWDGTTAYIIVDGNKSVGTAYSTPIVYHISNSLFMGENSGANWFNGSIDNVSIWNRPLTDAELIELESE